jgi:hypothetical protein
MKATIRIDELNIAHGVSDEHSRPILECVRIGEGKMVTADGFMLVVKPITTEGEGYILVLGRTILKAQQLLEYGSCTIESEGKNVTIKPVGELAIVLTDELDEGEFPRYEGLYPEDEPIAQIAIGIPLLKRLIECLPPEDDVLIQLRIREGQGTPIEFVAGETSGLIMPMFVGTKSEHWHKPEKETASAKNTPKNKKAVKK